MAGRLGIANWREIAAAARGGHQQGVAVAQPGRVARRPQTFRYQPAQATEATRHAATTTATTTTIPPPPGDSLAMRPCSILELEAGRCHWPLGELTAIATLFCGGVALPGRRYCVHHLRIARSEHNG